MFFRTRFGSPQMELESWIQPAGRSGGDFVNIVTAGDRCRILLGDVSGHGPSVARVAGQVRAHTRADLNGAVTPSLFRHWNRELRPFLDGRFVCLTYVEVDPMHGRVLIANAGNPAVLLRRSDGGVEEYSGTGPILGILGDADWEPPQFVRTRLAPFDRVVCFTDGLTESRNAVREFFGLERVIRLVGRAWRSPVRVLRKSMRAFRAAPEPDDVTVLALGTARAA